ncbi:thrombomodulin-like [Echeneis naucrates]|uniref:thrombomodulin-like n=1 Tax=Echeneis naucrates TaxID=173247 RepID=UPI0011142797|nr:thrombomodulin-like [Echeneis naucrates]
MMTRTARDVLLFGFFLCRLGGAAPVQSGHCAGNQCLVVLLDNKNFTGAGETCSEYSGTLLTINPEDLKILSGLLSGLDAGLWLQLPGSSGLQKCSSISVSAAGELAVRWLPCSEQLDGVLCQQTYTDTCGAVEPSAAAQVSYKTHWGFEVKDAKAFPPGTVAAVKKDGATAPDSKHLCFEGRWTAAPWSCQVMSGGCEHACDRKKQTCTCPEGHTLHRNQLSCKENPCALCASGCQKDGDVYRCTCNEGYELAEDEKTCVDVDECAEEDLCTEERQECLNTQGSYECHCQEGFIEEERVCVNNSICLLCEHMLCEKHNGVYGCACRKGYRLSKTNKTRCELHCEQRDCPAVCPGRAQCYCMEGYITDERNGTIYCTDINECDSDHMCQHRCENTFGSYKCLCHEGYRLHKDGMCVPIEIEEVKGEENDLRSPSGAVPHYVKTGSALGISAFIMLCAVLLCCLVRHMRRRCGKFKLSSLSHPDIDIFYLQQVTTDTYKKLSVDKQLKNDVQRQ